jgi:HK97 family phage major capsid protein
MDELVQGIAELQRTVKDHRADPATMDMAAVKAEFDRLIAEYEARQKVKRYGDELVKPLGKQVETGRFRGCDAFDLWVVKETMRAAGKTPSAELMKAMDSTTDTAGDDFVPTAIGAELWEKFYLESLITQALGPLVNMPTDPYHLPIWSSYTWYKGTENTATTASNPTTSQSIFTTTEQVAEVNWSYTLDEDSAVAMLPNLRSELVRSGGYQMDAFALNADSTNAGTGNINLDDADPADTSYYLSAGQDGLRHYWLVDDTGQGVNAGGDALTDDDILAALALMGKYAARPSDCLIIVDPWTYVKGLMNIETVVTLDKYGSDAVVLTGELAKYRGIPVIVSEAAPKTEADGKVSTTAGNNTLGQITIVNRRMWKVGARRGLLIELDKDIQKRQSIMVASFRFAVAKYDATSDHSAGIRNILV